MEDYREVCETAARIGGHQLLKYRSGFKTQEKSARDFVTDADIASQNAIHDFLYKRFPTHAFVGEENIPQKMAGSNPDDLCWIVDPLDGTLNYVHQLQSYSVSVALRRGNQVIAGAVFDPLLDEMFSADSSSHSCLNGESITVSGCHRLENALTVVSLPSRINRQSHELAQFLSILYRARSVRRLGSAALNLCYVADGRLDAYWASTVNLWDIAAGSLILQRAGGVIRDLLGGPLDLQNPKFAASASLELCEELEAILQRPDPI